MSNTNVRVNAGGIFLPLLCLMFIGLKLGGVISWSWWWVMAPMWVPATIALVLLGISLVLLYWADKTERSARDSAMSVIRRSNRNDG